MSVKICSCPKRDKEREEHDMVSHKSLTVGSTRSGGKRKAASESKSGSKKMRIGNPQELAHTSVSKRRFFHIILLVICNLFVT